MNKKINNPGTEPRGMLFSYGFGLGFNPLITAAKPRGIKPSPRIIPAVLALFLGWGLIVSCESLQAALDSMGQSVSEAVNNSGAGSGGSVSSARFDPAKRGDPDAANWDIAKLDTAKDADYLSGVEKDVVLETNKVRTDPKKYAELYIQPRLKYFSGKNYSVPGQITIVTQEGAAAVNGCIAALNRAKAAGILSPESGLTRAVYDHAADQGKTGQTGHGGSDGSTPFTRIARYGKGGNPAGENISYGGNTGRDIVCQLLIDDGVPSRGHRTNIMNGSYTQTGVGFGTHPQYRYMCAIVYAKGYTSN
jgi:uncharacterized protein YkwD